MCFYYSKCFERITYIKPNNGNSIKARDIAMLILQYIKALIKTNYFKRKKIHLVSPYAAESGPNPAQKKERARRPNLNYPHWTPKSRNFFAIPFLLEFPPAEIVVATTHFRFRSKANCRVIDRSPTRRICYDG